MLDDRDDSIILNCELSDVFEILQSMNLESIKFLFGQNRIIALDEAQNIPLIGKILKLIYDELPEYKLIVTGSSSLRNEIKKSSKFYFYDNGIRNAIINNLNLVPNRTDMGALWENFCMSERVKQNMSLNLNSEFYFWRTYDGAEIDLIEMHNTEIIAYEFKWSNKRKQKIPNSFNNKYMPKDYKVIRPQNFYELMTNQ